MRQFVKLNDGTLVNADVIARIGQLLRARLR